MKIEIGNKVWLKDSDWDAVWYEVIEPVDADGEVMTLEDGEFAAVDEAGDDYIFTLDRVEKVTV